jgi:hypothetical protein
MFAWPGFLVDAPFDSGMSGGPVVDKDCVVRGMVCADLSEDVFDGAAGSGGRAFASALWPLMSVTIDLDVRSLDGSVVVPRGSRLLEWVRSGIVDDRGAIHEHLSFGIGPNATESITYEW